MFDLRVCRILIEMADAFFSSSWRIVEPDGCTGPVTRGGAAAHRALGVPTAALEAYGTARSRPRTRW
jgi:hypothetical protein